MNLLLLNQTSNIKIFLGEYQSLVLSQSAQPIQVRPEADIIPVQP